MASRQGSADIAVLLGDRAGPRISQWRQERWLALFYRWKPTKRDAVDLFDVAPEMARWVGEVNERWVRKGYRAGLSLKPHRFWPPIVTPMWRLWGPPAPGDCLRGWMRPGDADVGPMRRPPAVDPKSWLMWKYYVWGCPLRTLARTMDESVEHLYPRFEAVISTLMSDHLDVIAWALNPNPATIPEHRLSPGWYARNERWLRAQLAIGRAYDPGPHQRRQLGLKERSWPSEEQLKNPPRLEIKRPWLPDRWGTNIPRTLQRKYNVGLALGPVLRERPSPTQVAWKARAKKNKALALEASRKP